MSGRLSFKFLTVSIEAKKIGNKYYCMMDHGRENSNKILSDWIKQLNKYNVGEIILNSIDNDGIENGFDFELLNIASNEEFNCPKVINGGAGNFNHFMNVLEKYDIDGFSIATALHFNKFSIKELKEFLISKKVNINPL